MLSTKTTETVLLVAPAIKPLKEFVKRKLLSYSDIQYHTQGMDADYFFSLVIKEKDKYDALGILENAVNTALSFLSKDEKRIIELTYFNRMSRRAVASVMGVGLGKVQYNHRKAFKNLQEKLYFLGITDKFLIRYFNDDGIFIDRAKNAEKYLRKDVNGSK